MTNPNPQDTYERELDSAIDRHLDAIDAAVEESADAEVYRTLARMTGLHNGEKHVPQAVPELLVHLLNGPQTIEELVAWRYEQDSGLKNFEPMRRERASDSVLMDLGAAVLEFHWVGTDITGTRYELRDETTKRAVALFCRIARHPSARRIAPRP